MTAVSFPVVGGLTKNAGELSETYAVVYILGNGSLLVVNGKLAAIAGQEIKFLGIQRLGDDDTTLTYRIEYGINGAKVRAFGTQELEARGEIDCAVFKRAAQELIELVESRASKKISIAEPQVVEALRLLGTNRVSAKASDKSDFFATVQSGGIQHTHGFSLKSQIAGSSTLINASKESTYFEFEVTKDGRVPSQAEIDNLLQETDRGYDSLIRLMNGGYDFTFFGAADALTYNLRLVDTCGPEIVASLLLEELHRRADGEKSPRSLAELVARLAHRSLAEKHRLFSLFGKTEEEIRQSFAYKVKGILLAFSAGATPGKRWDGQDTAEGGIIVVKKGGEVVCLQLSTRNAIGEYLLNSCRFESPSTTRHHWGTPYFENGRCIVRMQLQVRFTA